MKHTTKATAIATVTAQNTDNCGGLPMGLRPDEFVTEASLLGIDPGVTPRTLKTTLGNRQPFILTETDEDGNMKYMQQAGCITLRVWND